ncbi:radical SAM protein [Geobacter hydrogenophilus]|uniref:Radical SAM protein n=1 Tax=Geobacter hydrogenophilus TaxID=40983 RepID=A0A9W6G0S0_9BACT|nr:radical SAM protein [Geobacter hydrogenophilus]MBT0895493.1 radical SAM protein [Geobacter hydrogenophilus]GLI38283.1 radical SAM protein [Geobacter hydrogenophilus]
MLLIHPPVAKVGEPPAGVARLAGALRAHDLPCRVFDANLEGLLWLMEQPAAASDTWTRRAAKGRAAHLATLREPQTYRSPDRYVRAVKDLNRLLAVAGKEMGATVGLADYEQAGFSPVSSADLLRAAAEPERNPFFTWFSRRLPELLDGVRVVGLSLNYLSQAVTTFAIIGFIRQRFPGLTVVLGGGLVTSWVQRPGWRNHFGGVVDHLVAGPGEEPLLALLGAAGPQQPALPAYDLLPLADYLSPGLVLPYSAASGCWWNRCSFCPERAEGNPYRPIPASQALAELRTLVDRHRPALIHLLDNAVSPTLLHALADTPPGAPWYGFARIDDNLTDRDFCHALKRSGCVMLKLGLESGDQGVLDRLHKGIDVGTAGRVLENLRVAGIAVYGYLLFGTPAETEEDARRTLEFVVRHREAITFLNLAVFNMPAFGDEAADHGTDPFYEGDLSLYTGFRHPRGWGRREVRRFLSREFTRHPVVAEILRRDPPLFTSNHAPFIAGG